MDGCGGVEFFAEPRKGESKKSTSSDFPWMGNRGRPPQPSIRAARPGTDVPSRAPFDKLRTTKNCFDSLRSLGLAQDRLSDKRR